MPPHCCSRDASPIPTPRGWARTTRWTEPVAEPLEFNGEPLWTHRFGDRDSDIGLGHVGSLQYTGEHLLAWGTLVDEPGNHWIVLDPATGDILGHLDAEFSVDGMEVQLEYAQVVDGQMPYFAAEYEQDDGSYGLAAVAFDGELLWHLPMGRTDGVYRVG